MGRATTTMALWCPGSVDVSIDVPVAGTYTIAVVAWGDQAGDELPKLQVTVLAPKGSGSVAADPIRNKLVELHDKLLGVQVAPDSPDVEAAYRLFVDVMERAQASGHNWFNIWRCDWAHDLTFFDGILDNALMLYKHENGGQWYQNDWDRIGPFTDDIDFSDPHAVAEAWKVVLAYLMMDYRYLYLN